MLVIDEEGNLIFYWHYGVSYPIGGLYYDGYKYFVFVTIKGNKIFTEL